jgi:3-phytase
MFKFKKVQYVPMISAVIMIMTLISTVPVFANAITYKAKTVLPAVETTNSHHAGDTADDTCIWINPMDKKQSLILGDDKYGGLCVWNLDGTENQYLDEGTYLNNLDIRYNFQYGNQVIALIGAVNETDHRLNFYKVNPVTRVVKNIGSIELTMENPYGGCMYHNQDSDKFYFFVNWKDGTVQQWELDGTSGAISGNLVRTFYVGSQVEGCVADDQLGDFYIGEEEAGLWKYNAEPNGKDERVLVDSVEEGNITADVEGVTLYYGDDEEGYVICSSQGNSTFQVYDRKSNEYIDSFTIGATDTIDETTETDGCDVSNVDLGGLFSKGVFLAHDHSNDDTEYSNIKLVQWKEIAKKLKLTTKSHYNPVKGNNHSPDLKDIDDVKANAEELISFTIEAKDKDNNKLDYYALNLPDGAVFDQSTQQFIWTPASTQAGVYKLKFVATDGYDIDTKNVQIKVEASDNYQ